MRVREILRYAQNDGCGRLGLKKAADGCRFREILRYAQNDGCRQLDLQKAANGCRFREILRYAIRRLTLTRKNCSFSHLLKQMQSPYTCCR